MAGVLQATAAELRNGRPVPIGVSRAVRSLEDALSSEMAPVCLAEVIARINDLFGGELGPEEVEGFVKPVAAKAEKAPGIADQIDNNAKDQFLDSLDLRESIIDAAFDVEAAVGKLSGAAMGDDSRAAKLIRIIGEFMWETRRERSL